MKSDLMERLGEILVERLELCVDEMGRVGGKLPAGDAEYLKNLTGAIKNCDTILAMEGRGEEQSGRRGRDSMGRYTSRRSGYDEDDESRERSMHSDVRERLRRMADDAQDERVRRALRKAMNEV